MSVTFITGCARSGTTSLLKALGLSHQAHCLVEPMSNLNIESRELLEGRLPDPYEPLALHVAPRVARGLARRTHYIEKQLSLVPFLKPLDRLFGCRFIIPVRDGREVVASLINWHNQMFPIIYQECRERGELSPRAEEVLARQQGTDPYDYSLPRPGKDDPWHRDWPTFSRFEMVTWYWAHINRLVLKHAAAIDASRVLVVDYTRPTTETIRRIYDFIGLTDFDEAAVSRLLDRGVNSLSDRAGETGRFPKYASWPEHLRQRFWEIAFDTMQLLGYETAETRPRPPRIAIPRSDARAAETPALSRWLAGIETHLGPLRTVLDASAPGQAASASVFAPRLLTIADGDLSTSGQPQRSDLVYSCGAVDHTHDPDALLRTLAGMAGKVLYLVHRRGYHGGMNAHRLRWDAATGQCAADVSPRRAEDLLRKQGFASVAILPLRTAAGLETVILASREVLSDAALACGHDVALEFKPYVAKPSGWSAAQVVQQVNAGCAYFSDSGLGLANDLAYFREMLTAIACRRNLRPGRVEQLARGTDGVNLAIRADVDMDLVAALKMAHIAQGCGVPMSFYLLHTAPYYGYFQDGTFHRHEDNAALYRQLQEAGAEVGLHTDPYLLYLNHDTDGAQAVVTELTWLRRQGLRIRGTCGHNAAPVYGAESCEIFKGRTIRPGSSFHRNYVYLPLGVLDETQLELTYEAGSARPVRPHGPGPEATSYLERLPDGDFLRDYTWFRTYLFDNPYCRWGYSHNAWLLGKDLWAVAARPRSGREAFHFGITWHEVDRLLAEVQDDDQVLITLHPIYLGRRTAPGAEP